MSIRGSVSVPARRHSGRQAASRQNRCSSAAIQTEWRNAHCSAGSSGAAVEQKLPPRARFGKLCTYFWLNSRCKKGPFCDFLHADTEADRKRTNKVRADSGQAPPNKLEEGTPVDSSATTPTVLTGGAAAHRGPRSCLKPRCPQPDEFGFVAVPQRRPSRWNRDKPSNVSSPLAADSAGSTGAVGGRFAPLADAPSH